MSDLGVPVSGCAVPLPKHKFLAEGLRAWDEGWRSLVSPQKPKVQSLGYRPVVGRSPPLRIFFVFIFNTVLVKSFLSP